MDQRQLQYLEEILWYEETYKEDINKFICYEELSKEFENYFEIIGGNNYGINFINYSK